MRTHRTHTRDIYIYIGDGSALSILQRVGGGSYARAAPAVETSAAPAIAMRSGRRARLRRLQSMRISRLVSLP